MPDQMQFFSGLRDRDLAREGLVIAEGRLVVERLLAAGAFEVLEVCCVPALETGIRALAAGRCGVRILAEPELAALAGYPFHRGVLAVARRPASPTIAGFVAGLPLDAAAPLLLLPATGDPENLGALLRSAAAFGFHGVLAGRDTADHLSRRVLRVSMGASLATRFLRLGGPSDLERFREIGYRLVSAVLDADADDLEGWEPARRTILSLGEEYGGLGPEWLDGSDQKVTIGMASGPDSLNVAAAGAILMRHLAHRLASGIAKG